MSKLSVATVVTDIVAVAVAVCEVAVRVSVVVSVVVAVTTVAVIVVAVQRRGYARRGRDRSRSGGGRDADHSEHVGVVSHNQGVASDDRNASGFVEVREAFRELHDREIVGVADVDDSQAIMTIRRHVSIVPHDLKMRGVRKVIVVLEEVRNGDVAGGRQC